MREAGQGGREEARGNAQLVGVGVLGVCWFKGWVEVVKRGLLGPTSAAFAMNRAVTTSNPLTRSSNWRSGCRLWGRGGATRSCVSRHNAIASNTPAFNAPHHPIPQPLTPTKTSKPPTTNRQPPTSPALFEDALNLDPGWEAAHFAYGEFLDRLYVEAKGRAAARASGARGAGGSGRERENDRTVRLRGFRVLHDSHSQVMSISCIR
jgi:hypothetical protein